MKEQLLKFIEDKSPGAIPLLLVIIRRGEIDLQTLIDEVEKEIVEIDELFVNSNLPNDVDKNFINELLIKIRKNIYNYK